MASTSESAADICSAAEMQSDDSDVMEGYKIAWEIKNASLGFLQTGELIYSPDFQTNLFSTEWTFFLQFSRHDSSLDIYVQRNIDKGPQSVSVKLKNLQLVHLVDSRLLKCSPVLAHTFGKGDSLKIFKVIYFEEDIMKCVFETNFDKLRLSCSLHLDHSTLCHKSLLKLSSDMRRMFKNSDFCDTALCSPDGETRVHRFVLEARVRGWNYSGKRTRDGILKIPTENATESTIKAVLGYVYSAQIENDCTLSEEFIQLAGSALLGITNMESKFANIPTNMSATTRFKCKRRSFRMCLNRTKSEIVSERLFTLNGIEWCFKSVFVNNLNEESVYVRVCAISETRELNLHMRFVILLRSYCGTDVECRQVYANNISAKKPWFETTVNFEKEPDSSTLSAALRHILFYMEIWNGKSETKYEMKYETSKQRNPLFDILILSEDLLQLLEQNLCTDIVIKVSDGELKAHRAILQARSTVFAAMLQVDMKEKVQGEIAIEDVTKSAMYLLLKYIYSGHLYFGDVEDVFQLALAADKYDLIILRDGCVQHLCKNINKDTALELYMVLDFFQKEDLKKEVQKFIQTAYCGSHKKAMIEFRRTRPDLFEEIFCKRILRSTP